MALFENYHIFHRPWKSRKPMWYLLLVEFPFVVASLTLFGIAQPDVFRTLMWRIGYAEKLNSNPNMILYAYANHRPLPQIPFVWSQMLTDLNVAISVLAVFLLVAKLVAYIMNWFFPVIAVFVNFCMTALLATSVAGQAGADYADPRYPAPIPWYLSKSCDIASKYGAEKSCMIIKSTFAVTVCFLTVYVAHLAWSVWNMVGPGNMPTEEDDDAYTHHHNGKNVSPSSDSPTNDKWEMMPQTPRGPGGVPYTPRTQAFQTLDRKLPFRQHQYA